MLRIDYLLLSRETRALKRINKASKELEDVFQDIRKEGLSLRSSILLDNYKYDLLDIKTKEHQDKIDLFISMIEAYENKDN